MGASVAQVRYDRATATMKYGLRVADVVVVDATNYNVLEDSQVLRGANLALEIHRLPDYVAMPNGTRWNGVPVVLLVDDQWTASAIASDPSLRNVIACAVRPSSNWYYEYVDPWSGIYQRIDDAAYQSALRRLEEMQSVGHRFEVKYGRWIRLIPPSLRGRREVETALYSGSADLLMRRRRREGGNWAAKDVLLIEQGAVERDLLEYEHLVDNAHAESEMQRFYEQRPYVLGAGAYETTAHPRFNSLGAPSPVFPDLVQHPFNGGLVPRAAKIIELKTPRTRLLTRTGLDWHWARATTAGLAQTRRYAAHATAKKYKKQMEAIFGDAPKRVEKLLIAGRAGKYADERLALAREYDSDVEVRGYDEMAKLALERYAS
jgi:hypothetical protein